jgi:hypothetical protein
MQFYTKINSRVYKPLGKYEMMSNPANGFVFAHDSGWQVMRNTEGVTDIFTFARIFAYHEQLCRKISKLMPAPSIEEFARQIVKFICNELDVMTLDPTGSSYHETPKTYYKRTKRGYKVHGLIDGFSGFKSTGLYYVNIYDGGKESDCVKLLTNFKGDTSYYTNFTQAEEDIMIKRIIDMNYQCASANDVANDIIRFIYDVAMM